MKKLLAVFLSVCIFSTSALAADIALAAPERWMFDSDTAYQQALTAWEAGQPPPENTIESAGAKNDVSSALPQTSHARYPVGSYVDAAGNVWSADGELLSPGTTPAAPADEVSAVPLAVQDDADGALVPSETDTLTRIAALVSDIATDPPVFYVEDLRPAEAPVEVLDGLKALVTSIFGEYTPVTTTSVITQTVGNDTHQYLVETVAPGAAGVDYEWVAGVFLFGIMLFCLMKLLGGILK